MQQNRTDQPDDAEPAAGGAAGEATKAAPPSAAAPPSQRGEQPPAARQTPPAAARPSHRGRWLLLVILAAVIVAAIGGIWWWRDHEAARNEKLLTLQGNVDVREVNLAFKVGGRIAALKVDEGDHVKQGQVLAVLDRRYFEDDLRLIRAEQDKAAANLARLENGSRPRKSPKPRPASSKPRRPKPGRKRISSGPNRWSAKGR